MTIKQAMFYNIVSSVLSFIGMVGGMLLGNFDSATQWIYAATAGSFIYIALADLVSFTQQYLMMYAVLYLLMCNQKFMGESKMNWYLF